MTEMPPPLDRRAFLRFCGRSALLLGAAFGFGRLFLRRQVALPGQRCTNAGVCPTCAWRASCGLPQALARRRALEKNS